MQMFASNPDVAFGDVNLSEEPIRGSYSPGAGGWPTIRYFNQETGYEGAPYVKKTDGAMCDELGDMEYMQAYVEEAGSTSLCSAETNAGCSDKEIGYITKMKAKTPEEISAQVVRLSGMKAKKMKPELLKWVRQRLAIVEQLSSDSSKDEL